MATIGHIPNPTSVSVKTAGYTIPADRYARAVVNLEGSATFTINAVTALRGTQNTLLGGNLTGTTSSGTRLAVTTVGDGTTGSATVLSTDQKTVVQDLFLPPGTIIGGSGTWRAVVEEYPT